MYIEVEQVTPATVVVRRKALDMTQAVFAGMLGVSLSTVRNWEGGRAKVPPDKGAEMVRLLQSHSKLPNLKLKKLTDGSYPVQTSTIDAAIEVALEEPEARFTGDLYKPRGPRK